MYWVVIYGSIVVSHRANPEIRFLGLELIGVPIFGVLGGLAIAVGFNLARRVRFYKETERSDRIAGACLAGFGLGLNGLVAGWILMLPILAIWNSYDSTVPLFLYEADREQSDRWSNIGACVFGFTAFLAGFMIQYVAHEPDQGHG
jgi:hypothetical protein